DGKEIDGKGLDPDLVVTPLKLEKVAREEGLHEADLPGALKNPDLTAATAPNAANPPSSPAKTGPAATSSMPGASGAAAKPAPSVANKTAPSVANQDIGGANDEQLTQALDVLRGLAVFNPRASG
ncbi:MAG TPA: peptidase S41, partial [Stellaceae bacterium]